MEDPNCLGLPDPVVEDVRRQVRALYRRYVVSVAVVSLVVGGLIGFFASRSPPLTSPPLTPPTDLGQVCRPDPEYTPRPTVTPRPFEIYVSGAIAKPQVVLVPPGSLVLHAIEAAGGAAADADLDSLNLAAPLNDHQHVLVPHRSMPSSSDVSTSTAQTAHVNSGSVPLNVNTATAAELEILPKIGPALAQRIVEYREAHGPFLRKEDLQAVSGIGPATYAQLEELITVGE